MRSKNALRNLIVYLFYEAIVFVCGIVFPHFIILIYGSEINGLTSTITRILSLIHLVQAGAVGAAIFQMYDPVAKGDYEKQSAIIYSSRKFYNIVSIIYLFASLIVGLIYSFYLESETLSFISIFLSFLILALNGTNILLFNSICDIFMSPHQKKYLLLLCSISEQVIRYSLIGIVIFLRLNFLYIYVCYFIGGVVSVTMNLLIYKHFTKGKLNSNPTDKHYKIPNRNYLMLSSIGTEAVTASPTIIITTFVGLVSSSIFSVYAMIFTSMKTILSSIQLSFSAVFGNLTKTADDDKIYKVHSVIELITMMLGTAATSTVAFVIIPFIQLYTKGADVNYVYEILAIFVVIYTFAFSFFTSFSYIGTVYGLFKDTCKIIIIFGAVGIVVSLVSVLLFGMPFVMIGLILNIVGSSIVTLIVIKKKVCWFKVKNLLFRTIAMAIISISSLLLYYFLNIEITKWSEWIIYSAVVFLSSGLAFIIYCILFERKTLKNLIKYFGIVLKRRRR